jgi:hypothetical protein
VKTLRLCSSCKVSRMPSMSGTSRMIEVMFSRDLPRA